MVLLWCCNGAVVVCNGVADRGEEIYIKYLNSETRYVIQLYSIYRCGSMRIGKRL